MKGQEANVTTRSNLQISNGNAKRQTQIVTKPGLQKGRAPLSDISNANRPVIQQTKKSALQAVKPLPTRSATNLSAAQPNIEVARNQKSDSNLDEINDGRMEVINATANDEASTKKRSNPATTTMSLRSQQTTLTKKQRTSDEMEVELHPVKTWEDIDKGDDGDPSMVSEYVNEIYQYLRDLEVLSLFIMVISKSFFGLTNSLEQDEM